MSSTADTSLAAAQFAPANTVEGYKASMDGDGLRILEQLPQIIARGAESLTQAEKELLKWVGVFYRRPTPGKFMMRIRMPNGFARAEQLRAMAELSRRLGNGVVDITTRQQVELRGFTLESVPEIWEKLRRGPALAANGRGQRSKHQWLPARGSEPTRITGCLARCAGFGPHHRGQSG